MPKRGAKDVAYDQGSVRDRDDISMILNNNPRYLSSSPGQSRYNDNDSAYESSSSDLRQSSYDYPASKSGRGPASSSHAQEIEEDEGYHSDYRPAPRPGSERAPSTKGKKSNRGSDRAFEYSPPRGSDYDARARSLSPGAAYVQKSSSRLDSSSLDDYDVLDRSRSRYPDYPDSIDVTHRRGVTRKKSGLFERAKDKIKKAARSLSRPRGPRDADALAESGAVGAFRPRYDDQGYPFDSDEKRLPENKKNAKNNNGLDTAKRVATTAGAGMAARAIGNAFISENSAYRETSKTLLTVAGLGLGFFLTNKDKDKKRTGKGKGRDAQKKPDKKADKDMAKGGKGRLSENGLSRSYSYGEGPNYNHY